MRRALVVVALVAAAACAEAHGRGKETMATCDKTVGPGVALADAIAALDNGGVLCLEPGTYPANVVLAKSVTLRGLGAPGDVILDGGGKGSVLKIGGKIDVTVENLTIANGASGHGGGGIAAGGMGTLAVRDVVLRGNRAEAFGGAALYLGGGTATVERCRIVGNSGGIGGAILVDDVGRATIRDTLVVDNRGTSSAVYAHDNAQLALERVTIAGNHATAALEVRGITVRVPTVTVADSILSGATAVANGPRLAGKVSVTHSLLDGAQVGVTDAGGNRTGAPAFTGSGAEPFLPSETSPARGLAADGKTAGALR